MATFSRNIDWNAVTKTSPITPDIQHHLVNVYTLLTSSILSAALGSFAYLKFGLGGQLSFLAGFLLIIWLAITPKHEVNKRIALLLGFAFLEGTAIGPLLANVIQIDPKIVTTAFLATVGIFASFSASAYFSERRSYLLLGGLLGSSLSTLCIIGFVNIFLRSELLLNVSLYLGLLVFCGFVMFDTQLIIEKAANGQKDVVTDALELFLDFVNIFVRLLIILAKDKKEKK